MNEWLPSLASKVAESLVFVRIKQGVPKEDNGDTVRWKQREINKRSDHAKQPHLEVSR